MATLSVPLSHPGGAVGYINYAAGTIRTTKYADPYYGGTWAENGAFTRDDSGLLKDTFTFAQERKYGGYNPNTDKKNSPFAKVGRATGWTDMVNTWNDPHASGWDKAGAVVNFVTKNANNLGMAAMILGGDPEGDAVLEGGETVVDDVISEPGIKNILSSRGANMVNGSDLNLAQNENRVYLGIMGEMVQS